MPYGHMGSTRILPGFFEFFEGSIGLFKVLHEFCTGSVRVV